MVPVKNNSKPADLLKPAPSLSQDKGKEEEREKETQLFIEVD